MVSVPTRSLGPADTSYWSVSSGEGGYQPFSGSSQGTWVSTPESTGSPLHENIDGVSDNWFFRAWIRLDLEPAGVSDVYVDRPKPRDPIQRAVVQLPGDLAAGRLSTGIPPTLLLGQVPRGDWVEIAQAKGVDDPATLLITLEPERPAYYSSLLVVFQGFTWVTAATDEGAVEVAKIFFLHGPDTQTRLRGLEADMDRLHTFYQLQQHQDAQVEDHLEELWRRVGRCEEDVARVEDHQLADDQESRGRSMALSTLMARVCQLEATTQHHCEMSSSVVPQQQSWDAGASLLRRLERRVDVLELEPTMGGTAASPVAAGTDCGPLLEQLREFERMTSMTHGFQMQINGHMSRVEDAISDRLHTSHMDISTTNHDELVGLEARVGGDLLTVTDSIRKEIQSLVTLYRSILKMLPLLGAQNEE